MAQPQEQAAAILNHYFEQLARRAGLRWTERNRADIDRAAQLLSQDASDQDADTIPPYQPQQYQLETRVTQVLDQERNAAEDDPHYVAWRDQRRHESEQTRRMLARERGGHV